MPKRLSMRRWVIKICKIAKTIKITSLGVGCASITRQAAIVQRAAGEMNLRGPRPLSLYEAVREAKK